MVVDIIMLFDQQRPQHTQNTTLYATKSVGPLLPSYRNQMKSNIYMHYEPKRKQHAERLHHRMGSK